MKAILMLEDGKGFPGEAAGAGGEAVGEVIMNTAVVGYQEMMTEPAYAGKILVLTYPLIGNYGIAPKFNESKKVWLAGLAIKEKSRIYSNWQARESFDDFVKREHLPVISAIDTRALAVHLRQKGTMLGIVATGNPEAKDLLAKIDAFRKKPAQSRLAAISVSKITHAGRARAKSKIGILDLGVTNSIIRQLEQLGCSLVIYPYQTKPAQILKDKLGGLIISAGPEDDPGLGEVIENIKPLIKRLPIMGISAGHEVLAAALGAKITKLKLRHSGVNYPVHNPASYKGQITTQNHGYVADVDSVNKIRDVKVTLYNLNDRTVEEIESRKLKILGLQYSPNSPGFNEVHPAFKKFIKMSTKE